QESPLLNPVSKAERKIGDDLFGRCRPEVMGGRPPLAWMSGDLMYEEPQRDRRGVERRGGKQISGADIVSFAPECIDSAGHAYGVHLGHLVPRPRLHGEFQASFVYSRSGGSCHGASRA